MAPPAAAVIDAHSSPLALLPVVRPLALWSRCLGCRLTNPSPRRVPPPQKAASFLEVTPPSCSTDRDDDTDPRYPNTQGQNGLYTTSISSQFYNKVLMSAVRQSINNKKSIPGKGLQASRRSSPTAQSAFIAPAGTRSPVIRRLCTQQRLVNHQTLIYRWGNKLPHQALLSSTYT
jgi:hypothetical protein